MAEPRFSMTADDDLPRTLRREKEARAREAQAASHAASHAVPPGTQAETYAAADPAGYPAPAYETDAYDLEPVSVRRIDVPFVTLMVFFLKAVIAAIPALILLTLVLYGLGQVLKTFFPWLIHAKILIDFSGG